MLLAHDHKDVRVAVHEALVCLVLDKGGAEEHNVVKLALEGAPQLVQKVLCLTGIGGPHDQGVEGQSISWVHYTLVLVLSPQQALARVLVQSWGGLPWRDSLCISSATISPWVLRVVKIGVSGTLEVDLVAALAMWYTNSCEHG